MQYLHDFRVGETVTLGEESLSLEEIRTFAERYDPQPRYLDDSVAEPLFGGPVASQWQLIALGQSMLVKGLLNQTAHLGVPTVSEIKFLKHAGAGRRIRAELTVVEIVQPPEQPDRGNLTAQIELFDHNNHPLLGMNSLVVIAKKPRH